MNLAELKKNFTTALSGNYPSEEIQSFFNLLAEAYLDLSAIAIALNPDRKITEVEAEKFRQALLRLKKNEPIQYIIGKTEFYGLHFKVNKHTLIPRPETEELVEWILINPEFKFQNPHFLDIGTGSGCIAISLAKNLPNAKVSALDISEEALKIAEENAVINDASVHFFQKDILNAETLPRRFDAIVSNPPYVRQLEKEQMHPNVLQYEPATALFVENNDPLLFYRDISRLAKTHLYPGGKLFFEINEYLADAMVLLLKTEGFKEIEVKKDIYGKDRMLQCKI